MTTDVGAELGLVWNTESNEPPDPNEGFFTDLDLAMKEKVGGIYVNDRESGADRRLARVFFRWPQVEVTDQTYPFITLDLLRYERAADREQRAERFPLPYAPKNYTMPAGYTEEPGGVSTEWLLTEMPIPFDFVYQITAHARYNSHIREIMYQMLQNERLSPRGAWLQVGDTVRSMLVEGPVDASGMDQESGGRPKRHFRKVWNATVQTELFQSTIDQLGSATLLALKVDLSTTME